MEIVLILLCLALIFDAILIERLTRRVDALQEIVVCANDLASKESKPRCKHENDCAQ